MGILEAIGGLFSKAASGLGDLTHKAWESVKSVYLFAAGVFDYVGGAWDWMVNGLEWIGDTMVGAFARVLHLLEWLALHAIPEGLKWAYGRATHWAAVALHTATRWLEGLIHTVSHWALGELHRLWGWVTGELNRAWHAVADLWNWVEHTARHAVHLVLHPGALVAWILPHLVAPLLRWMLEQSAGLLVWLFKQWRREEGVLAHTLEDVLARLL